MTAWSLAIISPNRELSTSRALSDWNFTHHVFKIRRRGVHRGRARDRLLPAFPGYLFIVAQNAWDTLRIFFGIANFVGHGHAIEAAVNSLLRIADENGVIPTPELSSQRFKLGDRVVINGIGVLAGQRAIFQHLVDETRAMVLIDWMGRYVPIAIDERDLVLEASDKPKPRRKRRHRRRQRHRSTEISSPRDDGLAVRG